MQVLFFGDTDAASLKYAPHVNDFEQVNFIKGGKMNGTELNDLRAFLLLQKSRILNKSVEFRSEEMMDHEDTCDEADKVSNDLSLSMSIHLHERDRSSLLMIERALGKITEGTYGLCECCGEPIAVKRLKARPFAALCISCMEDQEESLLS